MLLRNQTAFNISQYLFFVNVYGQYQLMPEWPWIQNFIKVILSYIITSVTCVWLSKTGTSGCDFTCKNQTMFPNTCRARLHLLDTQPLWGSGKETSLAHAPPGEKVRWTKSNFLGLLPKSANDQWNCKISNCYTELSLWQWHFASIRFILTFLSKCVTKCVQYC